jgi:hypothetical protein
MIPDHASTSHVARRTWHAARGKRSRAAQVHYAIAAVVSSKHMRPAERFDISYTPFSTEPVDEVWWHFTCSE